MMKKFSVIIFILALSGVSFCQADDNSLMTTLGIAQQGVKVQAKRLQVISENLANESSVGYQRKTLYITNKYNKSIKAKAPKVKKYGVDRRSPPKQIYDPSHPKADPKTGFVTLSNVHKDVELANASEAQLSYEANAAVIAVSKILIDKTIDLLK